MISITRKIEFDAGHRIPDHHSICSNLHGHRYCLEITLSGSIIDAPGHSNNGMVMDFSEIKSIATQYLINDWDHAFLVYKGDQVVCDFLATIVNHKTVILDLIPTVENLVQLAFNCLAPHYQSYYGNSLRLRRMRLYETPNCWADFEND